MAFVFSNFVEEIIIDFVVVIILAYIIGAYIYNEFYIEPS